MNTIKLTLTLAAAVALAACSQLPIPATIDLRARMADASGSIQFELVEGEEQEVDLEFPSEEGQCFDLADAGIDVVVQSAQLHWNLDLTYDGPELSGMLQARVFVAGEHDELFLPQHNLGPVFTINLDRTTTRLAGTAPLNPTQLQALNDRFICWGVDVRGRDVVVEESGTGTIDFEINDLWLRIRFSVI